MLPFIPVSDTSVRVLPRPPSILDADFPMAGKSVNVGVAVTNTNLDANWGFDMIVGIQVGDVGDSTGNLSPRLINSKKSRRV